MTVALVRFTPGARTNWHSHANGQLLHCTDGVGLVATRDGTTIRMRAGDTVWTPAGEEHWHGGTADNMMCHYAILDETPAGDARTHATPPHPPRRHRGGPIRACAGDVRRPGRRRIELRQAKVGAPITGVATFQPYVARGSRLILAPIRFTATRNASLSERPAPSSAATSPRR